MNYNIKIKKIGAIKFEKQYKKKTLEQFINEKIFNNKNNIFCYYMEKR